MEDVTKELNKLNDALEAAGEELKKGPALQVDNEMHLANKYLSAAAQKALSKKAFNLIEMVDGKFFVCVYLGVRVRKENVEKGVAKVAALVNDLADKDVIHSCLAPMFSLALARMPMEAESKVVMSYVLVPEKVAKEINESCEWAVQEGALAKDLEPIKEELADGEFLAIEYVSCYHSLISGSSGPKREATSMLHDRIQKYLSVLPKGTEFIGYKTCAIQTLSIPYEVKFYNPLLKKVKRIDSSWTRSCEVVNDKLEQFNVFTGIRYFDKDDKELYKPLGE